MHSAARHLSISSWQASVSQGPPCLFAQREGPMPACGTAHRCFLGSNLLTPPWPWPAWWSWGQTRCHLLWLPSHPGSSNCVLVCQQWPSPFSKAAFVAGCGVAYACLLYVISFIDVFTFWERSVTVTPSLGDKGLGTVCWFGRKTRKTPIEFLSEGRSNSYPSLFCWCPSGGFPYPLLPAPPRVCMYICILGFEY